MSIPNDPVAAVTSAELRYSYEVGDPPEWFSAWSLGDGQAYVMIALDPTGGKLGAEIDEVYYRFVRLGYGWATWMASLGRAELIPYALALVGCLMVLAVFSCALWLRPRLGPRAWLIVLNPALYIGFASDTAEPMGILFLTIAMATGAAWASGLLGVTRPTFLVATAGNRSSVWGIGAAMAVAAYVIVRFGPDAMQVHGGTIGPPFAAYIENQSPIGWILAVGAIWTLARGVSRRDLSWSVAGLFVLCFGADVLLNPSNAWRAAGFIPVLWAFGTGYSSAGRTRGEGFNQHRQLADVA